MSKNSAIFPGAVLILIGGWLLAQNLGVPLPGVGEIWPAIMLLVGLGFLAQFFAGGRRDEGLVFVGVATSLLGAFFLVLTLGPLTWGDLGVYWPVFVLIGSAAFFAQWLAKPSDRGLLVPAVLALLVGGVAMLFTLGGLDPALAARVVSFWPVLLIVAGVGLLISYARRPSGG